MAQVRVLRVMIDLNVLLDVLQAREPWAADARAIWAAHNRRVILGHIAAHGLTNLFYIMRRSVGVDQTREATRRCMQTFEIVPVGRTELEDADKLAGNDLEDNLVLTCTLQAGLDAIVTRDPRGFPSASVPVFSPAEFLTLPPFKQEAN